MGYLSMGLPTLSYIPYVRAFFMKSMSTNYINIGTINHKNRNLTINVPAGANPADLIRAFMSDRAEDVNPDDPTTTNASSSVNPESHSGNSRGRKTQRLFVDEQTAEQEKTRLLNFLHLHNLGSREFDSSEDSPVNQIAVCFYRQWAKRNLLDEKAGSTAYVRFLKNECELPISVLEKALANVLSRMIFGDDRYPNWSGEISAYFQN